MPPASGLTEEAIEGLTARLSSITSLRLPGQAARGERGVTREERDKYVRALLCHDPGVFLERHGEVLTAAEVALFHPLRFGSYEVDFYLKLLEDRAGGPAAEGAAGPSGRAAAAPRSPLPATAKNRRLAHMERLEADGYFDEDAMREREPYLHHLFIGQYSLNAEGAENGGGGGGGPAPGGGAKEVGDAEAAARQVTAALAGSIMDRQDELELVLRREAEREAYDQQEEESESDDEDGGPAVVEIAFSTANGGGDEGGPLGGWPAAEAVTAAQRAEYAAAFEDAVKQKFLGGRDAGVDYAAVDADAGLDEHWAAQAARDAEERYFDAD